MGYVYKFIHKETGKYYIGSHSKPSKGSKYKGSGVIWRKALKKYGIDAFEKVILYEGDLYKEMEEKFLKDIDAANDPLSYNVINESVGASLPGPLNGMWGKSHSSESAFKCGSAFRGKSRPDMSELMMGENNPMYGKSDHCHGIINFAKSTLGKSLEDIYGIPKATEIKLKISIANKGISKPQLSEMYKGSGNPFYGKTHTDETKKRLKASWENNPKRKENLSKMVKEINHRKKGIIPKQLYIEDKCNYCLMVATKSNISKWHNDKCKLNPASPNSIIGKFEYIVCYVCGYRPKSLIGNRRRNFKTHHLGNCNKGLAND